MFKRKSMFVMEIGGLINYPLEEVRAGSPALTEMPDDDLRGVLWEALRRQVMDVAMEELKRHRQKLKRTFETDGHQWETGSEIIINQLGEHWVDFTVVFEGDTDGATAAAKRWFERVETFGGIDRINRAALRGTDGTNLQAYGEEIEEMARNLDDETKARVDELMDRDRDV